MRTVSYGTGDPEIRFDNPNLRWGSPSYLLEPGDPDYVPPIPTASEQQPKHKKMKHESYYPKPQAQQVIWLANFKGKLPTYGTTPLTLATGTVTAAVADAGWLQYLMELWLPAVRAWSKSCTDTLIAAQTGTGTGTLPLPVFTDTLIAAQTGTGTGTLPLPVFTAPALPTGVTAQPPGSLERIFALVQVIKKSGKSTDAINADLGIVGPVDSGPDLATITPHIGAVASGSTVHIDWGYQGQRKFLSSIEILVDRADTHGFVLLTIDTTPDYTDTAAWPTVKTIWTYKAIYHVDDAQVGHWSAPVSVTVGG